MPSVAEAQARLREAGKRLPEVECATCYGRGATVFTGPSWEENPYGQCPDCNGSGTVPSDLAKTVERAMTILCPVTDGAFHQPRHPDDCYHCSGTGRVLRPYDDANPMAAEEVCGRLRRVRGLLSLNAESSLDVSVAYLGMVDALAEGDALGALQAATKACEAVLAQEAKS